MVSYERIEVQRKWRWIKLPHWFQRIYVSWGKHTLRERRPDVLLQPLFPFSLPPTSFSFLKSFLRPRWLVSLFRIFLATNPNCIIFFLSTFLGHSNVFFWFAKPKIKRFLSCTQSPNKLLTSPETASLWQDPLTRGKSYRGPNDPDSTCLVKKFSINTFSTFSRSRFQNGNYIWDVRLYIRKFCSELRYFHEFNLRHCAGGRTGETSINAILE